MVAVTDPLVDEVAETEVMAKEVSEMAETEVAELGESETSDGRNSYGTGSTFDVFSTHSQVRPCCQANEHLVTILSTPLHQ